MNEPGLGFSITAVWVAVVVHGDGDEAVPATLAPNGMMVPLIAADRERLGWLRAEARAIARASGKTLKIIRLESRVDVETIKP